MNESASQRIRYRRSRAVFLIVVGLIVAACGGRGDGVLYRDAAAWVEGYALPSESVAVPESAAKWFADRPVVPLPESGDAFALLEALQTTRPDLVVACSGVAWDGVRAQLWFREHYRLLDVVDAETQPHASLQIFGYTPSPFDRGERLPGQAMLGTDSLELRAVRVSHPRLTPGQPLYVTLFWGGDLFSLPDAHRLVLRLVNTGDAQPLAQVESTMVDGIPANLLRESDDLLSRYTLTVPEELPAGDYRLILALYQRNGEPVVSESLTLAQLYRPPAVAREAPTPDFDGDWRVGDAIALVGYDVPTRLSPGETFRVALYWHANDRVLGDYKVFIHLMDAGGNLVLQDDAKPLDWTYPTTQWQPGEYIRDEYVLVLDDGVPRGDYTLFVGMYDAVTGVRLDVEDAQGQEFPDSHIELRVVKVR